MIKGLKVKNRIVMPPMGTKYGSLDGFVNDKTISFYEARARGGVGTVIIEGMSISPDGKVFDRMLCIDDDKYLPGLSKLYEVIKNQGAKVIQQLHHGGRQTTTKITGFPLVAPSPISSKVSSEVPKELSRDEIKTLVQKHAQAARRVKQAGGDGIEIHVCNGYLINQFLSPYSNKRLDDYGGDLSGRIKFLLEIIGAIREEVGEDYPIFCRLVGDEYIEGGITLPEAQKIALRTVDAGIDVIHLSAGIHDSEINVTEPNMRLPRGCFVHLAHGIKEVVSVPVIAVGGINDPLLAERILVEKKADLVSMGRALLADPDLPRKVEEGRLNEIRKCLLCNQCIGKKLDKYRFEKREGVVCTVNPDVGREKEMSIIPTKNRKRVVVIGGGVGGMEAARVAALRGHQVSLYERHSELGGKLLISSVPPYKQEMRDLKEYYEVQLRHLGVQVKLGHEITLSRLQNLKADTFILATGAIPITLGFLGKGVQIVTAESVLSSEAKVGTHVVMVGGGLVGLETSEYLATKGKRITVVEILNEIGMDMEPSIRKMIIKELKDFSVTFYTNSHIERLEEGRVLLQTPEGQISIQADSLVLAVGYKPDQELAGYLKKQEVPFFVIGDCSEPRKMLEAIREGSEIGREV